MWTPKPAPDSITLSGAVCLACGFYAAPPTCDACGGHVEPVRVTYAPLPPDTFDFTE